MKSYSFEFTTRIDFDLPIINHNFILKCYPGNCAFQRICGETLIIEPHCMYTMGEDSFGNKTISGSINAEHTKFLFSVKGRAVLSKYKLMDSLDRLYLYPSQYTKMTPELTEFLKGISLPEDPFEKVKAISEAVNGAMTYVKGVTGTQTTAGESFALKQGVCQDFAHIAIALLRSSGIPARYVAGFIEGDGETHAWVEYFIDGAWYGIDPTNNNIIEYGYIKLSHGRDSYDCSVERGCFASNEGIVTQTSEITVKVGEEE